MTLLWLQFLVCAALIARAGFVLSAAADDLAEAYGWGRGWVGLALLASVTSLPELASAVSAVAWVGAPDLAVGHLLGACTVNLLFLVAVDALYRRRPMYRDAAATHLLTAAFGILMLALVVLAIVAGGRVPALGHLGAASPLLFAVYLLALRSVPAHETGGDGDAVATAATAADSAATAATRRAWRRFLLAALVVVVAGTWLPEAADRLATAMGWTQGLVGTVFMAVVTTLPEMAVTLGALRIGALDMAIGNLLGSNLFNLAILALADLAYLGAPLLTVASIQHAGTAISAVVMTAVVMIGLVLRPRRGVLGLVSWVSVVLLAAYVVNAAWVALDGR